MKTSVANYRGLIGDAIKDRYPYFLTGLTLLILILSLVVSLVKFPQKQPQTRSDQSTAKTPPVEKKQTYTVQQGDYLWKIAENTYGSGYNAYDIAVANKIDPSDVIYAAQVLILPSVTPRQPTTGEVVAAVTTEQVKKQINSYTVKGGDYLWKIAQEVYGDGYAWTRIAQANNLTNPDFIFEGTTLIIP